jgi:hypothetical protein
MYISEKTPQKEIDLKKYMGVLEKSNILKFLAFFLMQQMYQV